MRFKVRLARRLSLVFWRLFVWSGRAAARWSLRAYRWSPGEAVIRRDQLRDLEAAEMDLHRSVFGPTRIH